MAWLRKDIYLVLNTEEEKENVTPRDTSECQELSMENYSSFKVGFCCAKHVICSLNRSQAYESTF